MKRDRRLATPLATTTLDENRGRQVAEITPMPCAQTMRNPEMSHATSLLRRALRRRNGNRRIDRHNTRSRCPPADRRGLDCRIDRHLIVAAAYVRHGDLQLRRLESVCTQVRGGNRRREAKEEERDDL